MVRGPMLLRAYRDGTVPFDADGWFATGDGGRFGADGKLEVSGRLSDMIITGGENVWPAAVERILAQHPGVSEVAVPGRPDPGVGRARRGLGGARTAKPDAPPWTTCGRWSGSNWPLSPPPGNWSSSLRCRERRPASSGATNWPTVTE